MDAIKNPRTRRRSSSRRQGISHLVTLIFGAFLGRSSITYDKEASSFLCSTIIRSENQPPSTHDTISIRSATSTIYEEKKPSAASSAILPQNGTTTKLSNLQLQNVSVKTVIKRVSSESAPHSIMKVVPTPINCSTISDIPPVKIVRMASIKPNTSYLVSFSWWDKRIRSNLHLERHPNQVLRANRAVSKIQSLILSLNDTTSSTAAAFIDVGANVGFMTNFATRNRPVYAIDPISYDIAKLCEGYRANLKKGWAQSAALNLYHAAAGPTHQANISIIRPPDSVGYFDRSSLSREAIKQHAEVVEEFIPMITVDSIIPDHVPIGVVKIDVQGHEYGVLQGMIKILGRTKGYPLHVFYEEQAFSQAAAGVSLGASAEFLQSFGYTCNTMASDVLCSKV